tara:strand:- start:5085 stop:6851 length:1767 start_codon:yes stop_codon:yes gene_type:complete
VDKDFPRLLEKGEIILRNADELVVGTTSIEPRITDEVFVLDTESEGLFRPRENKTVYQSLLEIPSRRRPKFSIDENGFEARRGFTYLLPLDMRLSMNETQFAKVSPKSSLGRLFLRTRLLSDYHHCYDELQIDIAGHREVDMWLLVQPRAFNVLLSPGISLNQIRLYSGLNSKLSSEELTDEMKKVEGETFFFEMDGKNEVPKIVKPTYDGALTTHLNLKGDYTNGIVGMRARSTPTPIDLRVKEGYQADDFFEPIKAEDLTLTKEPGQHFLFGSKEIMKLPNHLCAEMRERSHASMDGPVHFAGFFHNGFEGDGVYEVRSDETANMMLVDGMPMTVLDFFWTDVPDEPYDGNYKDQIGPRPPRYFRDFDFATAAHESDKVRRNVLVIDKHKLMRYRSREDGFQNHSEDVLTKIEAEFQKGFFQVRYEAEEDDLLLQPVPYILLFNEKGDIFSYKRADDIHEYGDERLFDYKSIGVGGHIIPKDGPDYIKNNIQREFAEEIEIIGEHSRPKIIGSLYATTRSVDRVHFGLIGVSHITGDVRYKEGSGKAGEFIPVEKIMQHQPMDEYETWSRILINQLPLFALTDPNY